MSIPATVRVNALFPFPALVQGSGPVTLTKNNGAWTVGFSIAILSQGSPQSANYPNCYIIYWDAIAGQFFKLPFSGLPGAARPQRLIISNIGLPLTINDSIINLNLSAVLTITLPAANGRSGAPLTFKDVGGNAHTNNVTFDVTGADTIDGQGNGVIKLTQDYQGITFVPANDGTSTGWSIE